LLETDEGKERKTKHKFCGELNLLAYCTPSRASSMALDTELLDDALKLQQASGQTNHNIFVQKILDCHLGLDFHAGSIDTVARRSSDS